MDLFNKVILILLVLCFMNNSSFVSLAEGKDHYLEFLGFIEKYGWRGKLPGLSRPITPTISQRGVTLKYQFPEDRDGYFQRIGLYEFIYQKTEDIPFYNGQDEQTYTYRYSPGVFPVQNYKELFPEVGNWEYFEYIRWNTYRYRKRVYIVYAYPTRQDIDGMFNILVTYIRCQTRADTPGLQNLEKELKSKYEQRKVLYEAIKIFQEVLQRQGYYHGEVDGMLGEGTIKALQRYLSMKGYYQGTIDGLWGKGSIKAISNYQKDLNINVTGKIDLETAKALEKTYFE